MKHSLSCLICFFLLSGYHIKKLLLASDILHFSVFGYRMQHSISCLIVRNRTNWSDRKGYAEKWSACICTSLGFWVACGDSIKKENNMGDNLLSAWSILVKFSIFQRPQRHANSNNGDRRRRSFSFGYIYGDFLRNGRVFRLVLQRTTRLSIQTFQLTCVVLSRKVAGFLGLNGNSTKMLSFTKKHMQIAPFCINRSKVLAILS